MAIVRFYLPANMFATTAHYSETITYMGYGLIQIDDAVGNEVDYFGTFTYDSLGYLSGGRIESVAQYYYGSLAATVDNLNVRALDLEDAYLTGDYFNLYFDALAGADRIIGSSSTDGLAGFGGDDVIKGRGGWDVISGHHGRDKIYGGSGRDLLYGDGDADRLFGGSGNDRLFGGSGRDWLDGGTGNDRLKGGAGEDVFVFNRGFGKDIVKDFQNNVDTIRLNDSIWGGGLTKAQMLRKYAEDTGRDVVLDFGRHEITFEDVGSIGALADDITIF